jgi:L,D-peptidoglycan transpeptidase YkuD (ErfK/YbiS/YcfS/YnhG family)
LIVLRSVLGAALLLALPTLQAGATSSSQAAATSSSQAIATYCPRPLHRATRLIIVTVPDMTSVKATLHTFERRTPADATWLRSGPPETAVVGTAGIGWSEDFHYLGKKDEPIKREGDKRTPAGIFRVAGPFGFEPSKLRGYTRLSPGRSFCVDDPSSLLYGKIVDKSLTKSVKSSEDMSSVPGLKRGMIVDYPARRGAKAGSCIFLHVWDGDSAGTNARIAMPEDRLAVLQNWSVQGFTAIAIVSEDAAGRFKGCLPLNSATSKYEQPAALPTPHPRRERKDQRAALTTEWAARLSAFISGSDRKD